MKIKKIFLFVVLTLNLIVFIIMTGINVEAKSAYKTYTLNRNGDLVETNEAYEAVEMIRTLSDGSTLNSAKDMFIDDDDYIYIADTGNKRIIIMDSNFKVLMSFGDDILIKPLGIYVVDNLIFVADYGKGKTNEDIGCIYVWQYDKDKTNVSDAITLVHKYETPESPILEAENFLFRPTKIAVDKNLTMYIVNEGTTSGVLMVNKNNHFIDYFASNSLNLTLLQKVERVIYQNNKNVNLKKNIPTPVSNIFLDGKGYFYTITQNNQESDSGDNLKKINIGGINYFDDDMYIYSDIVDAWCGSVENIYAVSSNGFLFEYDNLGNLLFQWGGKGVGNDKLGLFASASSIAVDSHNNIYVIDDNGSRNSIQVFRETQFASKIHEALDLYNNAKYAESISVWNDVLRYNSMLDIAYRGIGQGYMMNQDYRLALQEFKISRDHVQYSNAYWEIRNLSLVNNMSMIIEIILGFAIVFNIVKYTNRKYHYLSFTQKIKTKINKNKIMREFLYMFHFLKNPIDACYGIKVEKRSSILSAWLVLGILFAIYILGILFTGFIFNNVIIEETILIKEALKIIIPIIIFIIANYLMSSLMEGEGTFKAVFIDTIGALMPILVIYPFVILISNYLTFNESFIYHFAIFIMITWSLFLIYFNIKETHNYSVGQTFVNLFLSLIFMVIIIVALLMVYLMVIQVGNFITDIVKEVILRE